MADMPALGAGARKSLRVRVPPPARMTAFPRATVALVAAISDELAFAKEAAQAGAKVAFDRFGGSLERSKKGDGSWVTDADEAAEATIRETIAAAYPAHNILGEEGGLRAAGGGEPVEGAPTWIVDPIDGTNNFMLGVPVWGTLVGLKTDGEVRLGVCHAPALDFPSRAQDISDRTMASNRIRLGWGPRLISSHLL